VQAVRPAAANLPVSRPLLMQRQKKRLTKMIYSLRILPW
jgi:hypothetical protein